MTQIKQNFVYADCFTTVNKPYLNNEFMLPALIGKFSVDISSQTSV